VLNHSTRAHADAVAQAHGDANTDPHADSGDTDTESDGDPGRNLTCGHDRH
jgi:hypothetical protein